MIPFNELLLFILAALVLVITPRPNMIYLISLFYISFFPQFIKPEFGSGLTQSIELGITQMSVSFTVNFLIVLSAARISVWSGENPWWGKSTEMGNGECFISFGNE